MTHEDIRCTYSRDDMQHRLEDWMLSEYGHPKSLEHDARERWYRDFGLMFHFICDQFPAEEPQ